MTGYVKSVNCADFASVIAGGFKMADPWKYDCPHTFTSHVKNVEICDRCGTVLNSD